MSSVTLLENFLTIPDDTSHTQTQVMIPTLTNTNAQLQPKYKPMEYDTFDLNAGITGEYPNLTINEATFAIDPGTRIQIKHEMLLDHRAIVRVCSILVVFFSHSKKPLWIPFFPLLILFPLILLKRYMISSVANKCASKSLHQTRFWNVGNFTFPKMRVHGWNG